MKTRRDVCFTLPMMALLLEAAAPAQQAGTAAAEEARPDPAKIAQGTALLAHNEIFRADAMPVKQGRTGSSQSVLQGVLPTGEGIEMHNTVLLPGMAPHPPHRHRHSEWLFLREGNVEWMVSDGVYQPANAGDVLYAASMQLHGLRNVGTVPARYFVMAVGANLKG